MEFVWPVIVSIIILMILVAWISSSLKERRKKKVRERSIPYVDENLKAGIPYSIHINDGRVFESVVILGTTEPGEGQFSFTGFDEALVLQTPEGKKVFLKMSSIRFIQEL
ncbi:hypothetical protein E4634_19525 [Mangrovimicrobium sediminis]|uniref:Uncharacterized protein n=1 Tax=Mangrovimicrobium sediminis TaxID=2562682 RepID=A0A4Z0LUT8_9GAMM|nr:hypothetical protein [Haliea sp. SAOS-164]TGD71039.1 hypothetical protein E4634_19525 [Haliea sp. SAOS-164]